MSMLSERLQVLIDRQQRERLERLAAERQTSVATLVRDAIDLAYPAHRDRRQAALQVVLDAEPMDVGSPEELRAELDEVRAGGH